MSNYQSIAEAINSHTYDSPGNDINKHPVSDLVYRLLSNVPTWENFASTITTDGQHDGRPWQEWISLEYIHNKLHVGSHRLFT